MSVNVVGVGTMVVVESGVLCEACFDRPQKQWGPSLEFLTACPRHHELGEVQGKFWLVSTNKMVGFG